MPGLWISSINLTLKTERGIYSDSFCTKTGTCFETKQEIVLEYALLFAGGIEFQPNIFIIKRLFF
jgi:hypothetical protein